MKNNSLGPKLLLAKSQYKQQDEEDVPEEPSPRDARDIKQKLIKYKHTHKVRFDAKGRQIARGTGYGIGFDNFVTVCVFDPEDEVLQIKDTLSQLTNAQEQAGMTLKKEEKQKFDEIDNEVVLRSILKINKSTF